MLVKERTVLDFVRSLRGQAAWEDSDEEPTETADGFVLEYAAVESRRVDRTAGVIRGVKIIGRDSKNGRTYPPEVLERARGLYEGAGVFINHVDAKSGVGGNRDYRDRIGVLRGVRVDGSGLRGDLHFNPKHPLAEQLVWDAEHAPGNVGLSHVAKLKFARTKHNGMQVVEEIEAVRSVDLVTSPATTDGLFESTGSAGYGYASSEAFVASLRGKSPSVSIDHQETREQRGQPKRFQGGYHYESSAAFVLALRGR